MPNGAATVLEHSSSRAHEYDGRRRYSTVREPIPANGAATLTFYIYIYFIYIYIYIYLYLYLYAYLEK